LVNTIRTYLLNYLIYLFTYLLIYLLTCPTFFLAPSVTSDVANTAASAAATLSILVPELEAAQAAVLTQATTSAATLPGAPASVPVPAPGAAAAEDDDDGDSTYSEAGLRSGNDKSIYYTY